MNDRQPSAIPQTPSLRGHYLPLVLAVCAGIGFSVGVFFLVRWLEYRDITTAFKIAAEERAYSVKMAFDTEVAMLDLLRTSLTSDGHVEKDEFREILMPFHSHNDTIEAVEWIPRIPNDRRQEFEALAQRNGFEGYQITEADKDGSIIPAQQRKEYFPLYLCGPRPANKSILGYDIGSEPQRLECLNESRDTGKAVASGRIDFVQDEKHSGGFLVCLPAYERGKTVQTVAERRKYLLGFIMGVFRPTEMLATALARLQPVGIDVALFDASAPAKNRMRDFHISRTREATGDSVAPSDLSDSNGLYYEVKLDVAGHPWTVACAATPEFIAAHRTILPWVVFSVGLAFTGMLTVYLASAITRKAYLEQKVYEQTADLRRTQEEVVHRLVSAAQWSDEETGMHIRRTGMLSEALARFAGWFGNDLDMMRQAAPLHDIGKIGIPDAILQKPGKLTLEEFEVMKTHTRIGADILANADVPMLQMAREIALNHHERWDGKGYPRGLVGKAIPECARIVAIVDVYDALTHDRVYRPAMPENEVLAIMQQGSGTHFDPALLSAFFLHLAELRRMAEEHPDETQGLDSRRYRRVGTAEATVEPPVQKSSFEPDEATVDPPVEMAGSVKAR